MGHAFTIDDPYRYGPVLTDFDLHLLAEGTHFRAWDRLGARPITLGIRAGVHFAVWAPSARRVSVVGDFNGWDGRVLPMRKRTGGYWEIFVPDLGVGDCYKFEVAGADGSVVLKADPFGRYFETPPRTASVVWNAEGYEWGDAAWMKARPARNKWCERPMSIYEVHLGSWRWPAGSKRCDLHGTGADARAVREGDGVHAPRVAAGDGAPLHRLVGLSGDRFLRADQPLRHAGGVQGVRRCLPPGRPRRDPRLGAGALPERPARPRPLRRHRGLRACRSAPGRAPGLGDTRLQLRASRGPLVPALERDRTGSSSFTSTDCASMRSRRCSTSITRGSRGSGWRTSSAAARTSTRSSSSSS